MNEAAAVRRHLARVRYLVALEDVATTVVHRTSPLRELVESTHAPRARSRAWRKALENADGLRADERRRLFGIRGALRAALDAWKSRYGLDAYWMDEIAAYTLLWVDGPGARLVGGSPRAPRWQVPPQPQLSIPDAVLRIEVPAWQPEFEAGRQWRSWARIEVMRQLDEHLSARSRSTPARQLRGRLENEARNLRWLALHRAYGWGTHRIAKWALGPESRLDPRTRRGKVRNAIATWTLYLGLPESAESDA